MWQPTFIILLASFSLASGFGSLPPSVVNIPKSFTLRVPDRQIQDFKSLLTASNIGSETWYNNHEDGQFGTSRQWLADAKIAWQKLDWRKQERRINSFPNFKTTVNDIEVGSTSIHFAALFSKKRDALPLLFLHGWPGSFLEFLPMLDLLKNKYTPDTLPYHVIVPSLPHYGLSGGPLDVELTLEAAARILNQLMLDLGFGGGYGVQGGDIGSFLARILSATFPECKAFHINMLAPGSQDEILSLDSVTQVELEHIQHMIGEKFLEWPDHRYPLSLDTILTLVSFYWYTDTFQRSMYPYRALAASQATGGLFTVPTSKEKPFGYSVFPAENLLVPEAWARQIYPNLALYKRNEKGGHFAALEQPEVFLQNVQEFIGQVRPGIGI
ncbi:epoxide hydrolase [Plectosphaerella cucumerina]|uniref:Epoxide hydrolase n=1 Tax=Plectosphaerella cucumerina TaxID=40658 RepID=A0A8K0TNJ5_9PEZI|nr:epoxide hydrolase [Plectosphaerella cucumerina]